MAEASPYKMGWNPNSTCAAAHNQTGRPQGYGTVLSAFQAFQAFQEEFNDITSSQSRGR